jgi:undecaprenyl-diphosphatase
MPGLRQRLLALDAQYTTRLRIAEKPGLRRSLAVVFAHSGDSWFWLLALILVWLGYPAWREWVAFLLLSILITALVVFSIKLTVRRKRPEGEWGGIYRKTDPHSFPSGHAARAMMLAVVGLGLGPAWFSILLLFWAPLVTLARVAMGVHYVLDVLAGALLGVLMGLVCLGFIPWLLTFLA